MAQAQDFTKIHTKAYKVWRILQAPGIWGQIYRDREKALANWTSAIIFPEQLLGLNQAQVFSATLNHAANSRTAGVHAIEHFILRLNGKQVSSYQEIYDWEGENNDEAAKKNMTLGGPSGFMNSTLNFHDLNLFSNRKSAVKMATRWLEKF